ncbi:MAG: SPFH domain-containing protein [Candidatus Aenigmatarchaeota archaeon]
MGASWERDKLLIAERFKKDELPGFLTKEFIAKDNESIVLERKGEIYLEKGPGKITVSSFMKDFTDILLLDKGEKVIEKSLKHICFSDAKDMELKVTIKFRIANSDKFSKKLMGENDKFFIDDVWNQLFSSVFCKIFTKWEKINFKDLLNEKEKTIQSCLENEIKKKFKEWGILLTGFFLHIQLPKYFAGFEEKEEKIESKIQAPSTQTLETPLEKDIEKKVLEERIKMEMEKKEMYKDMEEALEALEIKELMDKEKEIKSKEDISKFKEELKTLQKAKEVAEKKFYKKEINEKTFQKIIEDIEKRIIEIETKLKMKNSK